MEALLPDAVEQHVPFEEDVIPTPESGWSEEEDASRERRESCLANAVSSLLSSFMDTGTPASSSLPASPSICPISPMWGTPLSKWDDEDVVLHEMHIVRPLTLTHRFVDTTDLGPFHGLSFLSYLSFAQAYVAPRLTKP